MDLKGKHIILGSNSPRRRELLKGLDIDFEVDTQNNFEESFGPDSPYGQVPRLMSEGIERACNGPVMGNLHLFPSDIVP